MRIPCSLRTILIKHGWKHANVEISHITRMIKEGDVFVDVGASIGNFALVAAQIAGFVVCFEPVPELFTRLKQKCRIHNLSNVRAFQLGVSDREGIRDLFLSSNVTDGRASFSPSLVGDSRRANIKTVKLDDFLPSIGVEKVDAMKIDVQGAELNVLRGAEQIIRNNPDIHILCELHLHQMVDLGYSPRVLKQFMSNLHFETYSLRTHMLARVNLDDAHLHGEKLFFTRGRPPRINPLPRVLECVVPKTVRFQVGSRLLRDGNC